MNELIYYNAAKSALAQAADIDEVKDIKDKAEAIRLYAQQQRDEALESYAAKIKARAMRRIGELSREIETKEHRLPINGTPVVDTIQDDSRRRLSDLKTDTPTKTEVLEAAGISKSTAHRCEKLAAIPIAKFDAAIEKGETSTQILKGLNVHVSNNSGENEWYTPTRFIEAARKVMGRIDLDPASSLIANKTVRAKKIYTIEDNGLDHEWNGNIWLNPPYSQPEIGLFCAKVCQEYEARHIERAIILVNNATETKWFQMMLQHAKAVCFPSSRIKFLDPEGVSSGAPLQGQAILYIARGDTQENDVCLFMDEFAQFGIVLVANLYVAI